MLARIAVIVLIVAVPCSLASCGDGQSSSAASSGAASPLADLGEALFNDPALSASGALSCAGCHDAARAFAGSDGLAVPLGGATGGSQGTRNAPSLRYVAYTPEFHFEPDGTPVGGFDRDGRAATPAQQALGPLLSSTEMANGSAEAFKSRLLAAGYAERFRATFGEGALDDAQGALGRAALALQQYQLVARAEFAPFTSRFDAWLAGSAALDAQELRGYALFNDPQKGNCAACHPSTRSPEGTPPLFTDFSYDALGVPRNPAIAANADPDYYDLGLCGPARADLAARTDLCGAFKVPTLRNVALTAPYFHNGVFATLEQVVAFYARRDTNPEEWYPPQALSAALPYDDLPESLRGNVNRSEVPYGGSRGGTPRLDATEIAAVVAFLRTLTDGYTPTTP